MSGQGSGFGGTGTPGGGSIPVACLALRFEAFLASVTPVGLSEISVGETLSVVAEQTEDPKVTVVAAKDGRGRLVGVVPNRVADLLACLAEGYSYGAVILEIEGGAIKVRVSPR